MRYSLAFKLTLAFLLVSLIGVVFVAIFSRLITEREFDRLTLEQNKSNFVAEVADYYHTNRSWDGVERALRHPPRAGQPGGGQPGRPLSRSPMEFGLSTPQGVVLIPTGPHRSGERLPPQLLAQSTPLEIDGEVVGLLLLNNVPPPRNPLEEQYLHRINRALLGAALAAVVIALLAGIFLARNLTRPLRELTLATQAVAGGALQQTVPVRSKDELGQLAVSFNQMSLDLAQANRLRRQMTADIAHDLRTPLTVISGYIEALRDGDLQPTPARFEAMHLEAQHLQHLVQDLRTLSLADAGELALNVQPVAIEPWLKRVAAAYQHQAEQQGIALKIQLQPNLPELSADPERLAQVFGNLVSNALRYTPDGGQIRLTAQAEAGDLLLQVQDTGCGIPAADLPFVFQRFYRADEARQQHEGESGLGLAIAKAIVEAHGGTIGVESVPGTGTTFQIRLPL